MYIPILKTRKIEMKVLKDLNYCFSDSIIPMFETIDNSYEFNTILTLLNGNKAFLDLFRFSTCKYGERIDITKAEYSWKITNDKELYISELKKIDNNIGFIPVISIKKHLEIGSTALYELIKELQEKHDSIAFRFTDEFMNKYNNLFSQLRTSDYLMMDIEEQNSESKFIEIDEFLDFEIECKKIILNSHLLPFFQIVLVIHLKAPVCTRKNLLQTNSSSQKPAYTGSSH